MKILLDTNAYSELKRGQPDVAELVRGARRVLLSAVVAGELLYGFRLGARFRRNHADLVAFLARDRVDFLPITLATADRFSRIMATLRREGTPIPTNDVWIAAHAMEHGAELISFDTHFERVAGLALTRPDG